MDYLKNTRRRPFRGVIAVLFAVIMIAGLVFARGGAKDIYAADPIGSGEGTVKYQHESLGQGEMKMISQSDRADAAQGIENQYVYCINPTRSPSENGGNMDFRWRWNLDANAWIFDNSQTLNENHDYELKSADLYKLKRVLYNGFPHNASGILDGMSDQDAYEATQNAVYWVVCYGNGSAPSYAGTQYKKGKAAELIEATADPASSTLYMYVWDTEATQSVQNTVGLSVWSTDDNSGGNTDDNSGGNTDDNSGGNTDDNSGGNTDDNSGGNTDDNSGGNNDSQDTTPTEKLDGSIKTRVKAGKKQASSTSALELTTEEAKETTEFTDTISYKDMVGGDTYKVTGTIMKIVEGKAEATEFTATEEFKADASGTGEWDLKFTNVKLEPGTTYVVFEEAQNTDESKADDKAEHKDINDLEQTIKVSFENEGVLATTVKAGDKTGSNDTAARLTYDETKALTKFEDIISYSNLKEGVKYTVTGQLVELDADDNIVSVVMTNTQEFEAAKGGSGEWTMTFDNVTLKTFSKYVVFESAYAAGGEDKYATKDTPIKHENVKDLAQTILTEDENGKVLGDSEEAGQNDSNKAPANDSDKALSSDTTKKSASPSTGDVSGFMPAIVIAAASAAGIIITSVKFKSRRRR